MEIKVTEEFINEMLQYREVDKSVGLLENCSRSPIIFSELMLGMKLYAWQVYFLNNITNSMFQEDKEHIALTSRQIGKSTSLAIFSLWCTLFNKYPGTISENTSVGIASASDVQAKKLLYEMKKLIRIGDRFMHNTYHVTEKMSCGDKFFTDLLDEHEPNNTTTITFKPYKDEFGILLKGSLSGSVIKSYPPTAIVLGETFSVVVIDEAGKTDKITDQFFYDYMYPTGNSTDAVRIYTSTPWVSSGFFYRMVDPDLVYNETPVEVVTFTVDAIAIENPKYHKTVMKTVQMLNEDGKVDEVQRAYYCRFVKGETAYFDPDDVTEVFREYEMIDESHEMCDLGVDFGGQTVSRTVLTVTKFDEKSGRITRMYHKAFPVGKDNNLIDEIKLLYKKFNIQRVIPDECPQGDYLIREMVDIGWDVHPMSFATWKVKKYGAFRSEVKRGNVESYDDNELRVEMLAMETMSGVRNTIIKHAPGYTDDLIDSFVMSSFFFVQDESRTKILNFFDEDD